jgi:5-methyltetrahydrofolate--homocysteine methyltransferase
MDRFLELKSKLVGGNMDEVVSIVQEFVAREIDIKEILEVGLIPGMNDVGEKMGKKEMFIPEVLMAARAMEAALKIIKPLLLQQGNFKGKGTVVLGTVRGDIHDIGKNLVRYVLEGGGFSVVDLGVDVSPDAFLQSIYQHKPLILGMSAMLTTTMREMERTIKLLEEQGYRDKVKIMIGGAPVNRAYATNIGADGYADDASRVVKEALQLVS